jgi:hypothetical protein
MDPTNNRIVMDFCGLMTGIFGYDPSVPTSHSEFVAKQTQLEKESVEKVKAEGRRPNPKLCHMCKLVKLLSPTTAENDGGGGGRGGFKWDPECWYLLFGNWHQLNDVLNLSARPPPHSSATRCGTPCTRASPLLTRRSRARCCAWASWLAGRKSCGRVRHAAGRGTEDY